MRTVTLIEAPTSAGAYAPGQEDGPRALLDVGLVEELQAVGITVHIGGQASPFRWRPDPENPRAANADAVIDRASQVASLVRSAPAGNTILVLGGDCTVGVGTVAGLLLRSARAVLSPLAACDSLAVHFDVDLVDYLDAPLAENTDRGTAPSLEACGEMLSALLRDERVHASR
jgi:arginase family enzyme